MKLLAFGATIGVRRVIYCNKLTSLCTPKCFARSITIKVQQLAHMTDFTAMSSPGMLRPDGAHRPTSESSCTGGSVSIYITTPLDLREHRSGTKFLKTSTESQGSANEEWEGEVVEEVLDGGLLKFRVAWVPTLEPEENLSAEMRKAWEEKKAKMVRNKPRAAGVRSRVETRSVQTRLGRGRNAQSI